MTTQLNLNTLRSFVGNDPELVEDILGAYIRFLPKSINAIKNALEIQSASALLKELHQLKPNLENVGVCLSDGSFNDLYRDVQISGITSDNQHLVLEVIQKTEDIIKLINDELKKQSNES
jgi:hypothetical protein